jgi:ABC-type nickel/cobalt efflux system permease component RcnA
MKIDWASLGLVSVVSLAAGIAVVVLVSFALVGLSARVPERAGGPDDGAPKLSPAAGTTVAVLCLAAVAAIVLYGLYIIAF